MKNVELKQLGDQYEEQGDYESAELLLRKAITLQEKELGEDHPSLAVDLYNLGLLCYSLDNYGEAESFLMRAWAIERRSLGAMHPHTLATLEALSELYYDANRNVDVEYKGLASELRSGHAAAAHVYH